MDPVRKPVGLNFVDPPSSEQQPVLFGWGQPERMFWNKPNLKAIKHIEPYTSKTDFSILNHLMFQKKLIKFKYLEQGANVTEVGHSEKSILEPTKHTM